jgi:site-specific DNA recombinase
MKIAALYARVSSAKQQLNENIASQVAAIEEYARQNDYQISPQHVYKDDGFSGARLDRPALDRLRDAVAQGEVEAVLILSPDRLARQFAYQYIVVEEFERAGCAVVFTSHNFGSSPADRMLREMTGVFAEYERAMITERGRRGRLYHARQGQIWMKEGPYGYTYIPRTGSCPGKLVINEAEADVVRMIFRLLVDEQLSAYQINERLYESGIRTRHGKERWSSGTIINLMRNPVYTGVFHYNKKQYVPAKRRNMPGDGPPRKHNSSRVARPKEDWIPINVPAIIDQETWDQAREQLQRNKERAPRNNKKFDYLLKGLLVCGCCQLRMHGHAGIPATRIRRYLCSHKESQHAGSKCPNRTVQAEMIEELVWQSVSELLRNPQVLIEQYNQRKESDYGAPEQQEQQRLKRRMAGLERESQRLIDAYQSGVIELDDLKERRERVAEERRRMEERLNSLEQQKREQQRQAALATTVEEFCRNISAALDNPSFETKQKILRLVVERVEFVEDQITIKHVIPISDVRLQRDQHVNATPQKTVAASHCAGLASPITRTGSFLCGLDQFRPEIKP